MSNIQKLGALAAFINPVVGLAMLIFAIVVIGSTALSDPFKLVEMAINNPLPLFIQDALKLISAGISVILVMALDARLRDARPRLVRAASIFGFLSAACLVVNAGLSLVATSQAETFAASSPETGIQLNGVIALVALAVIFLNGPWYLLTGWVGFRSSGLPKGLAVLGMVMGAVSLIPPLGIIVLVLSLGWSVWLGRTLMLAEREPS